MNPDRNVPGGLISEVVIGNVCAASGHELFIVERINDNNLISPVITALNSTSTSSRRNRPFGIIVG